MKFASSTLISLSILLGLLAAGAVIRFHNIDKESLWLDEYWSVYLSTGRGNAVFDAPTGVVLDPPPNPSFLGAPSIWHIWTGLVSAVHPPIYFMALRAWIDLFGDSDFSTRTLSALCSLAAIVAMFETVRRARGPTSAILAAAMMTFSVAQIDFSQETRQYTMLVLVGILTCAAMLSIHRHGATPWRLAGLAISLAVLALTHYLAVGAILGVGLFALIALRGRDRRLTIMVMGITLLIVAAVWGPQFWRARAAFEGASVWGGSEERTTNVHTILGFLLEFAHRLVLGSDVYMNIPAAIALAILAFLPLAIYRRSQPDTLLWSLWVIGSLSVMTVADLHAMHTRPAMLSLVRYILIASVGLYPLLATPNLVRFRWAGPIVVTLGALLFGIDRYQLRGTEKMQMIDWKSMALAMDRTIGPRDVLVFAAQAGYPPVFSFIVYRHYSPRSQNPVVILLGAATPDLLADLAKRSRVWLVGDPKTKLDLLPGWQGIGRLGNEDLVIDQVFPPDAAATR